MRDFRDAKAMGASLRKALAARGHQVTHSDSLELISNAFGFDNWNILAAKIDAAAAPSLSPAPQPPKESDPPGTLYCSFCGKSQHQVAKLIAGPKVFICDKCVGLCNGILTQEEITNPLKLPLPEAIAALAEHSTEKLVACKVSIQTIVEMNEQSIRERAVDSPIRERMEEGNAHSRRLLEALSAVIEARGAQ